MESIINVKRDNESIIISFSTDLPYDCEGKTMCTYIFSFQCVNPAIAELMCRYFHKRLNRIIKRTRKNEYLEGYYAGKGHKKKKEFFYGWI